MEARGIEPHGRDAGINFKFSWHVFRVLQCCVDISRLTVVDWKESPGRVIEKKIRSGTVFCSVNKKWMSVEDLIRGQGLP